MDYDAAALFGVGEKLQRVTVSADALRPDEVRVRMVAAGICHTDLTVLHGRYPAPLPIILGHEGSGIVEEVGSSVTNLAPGDPVVLTFMSCGHCVPCGEGRPAYCRAFGSLNISGFREDGSSGLSCHGQPIGGHFFGQSSFARFATAHRRNVVRVRADAPLALLGPFGCAVQTGAGAILNALRPPAGSSCIVFGGGGVGLSAVMAARVAKCDPIIVVEPRCERRVLALELGATLAIDPAAESDLVVSLTAATGGGADAIVDTTGIGSIVTVAVATLGPGGRLGLIGMSDMVAEASFAILGLINKGASVQGIIEGDSEPQTFIPLLVDLFMEGQLPVDRIVTYYDFKDINEALAAQTSGQAIKPILRF